MNHLFVDTNVVLDFVTNREPFTSYASQLFELAERKDITLYVSALSYTNIHYIISKKFPKSLVNSILKDLFEFLETIDVKKETVGAALNSSFDDFEDAVQNESAISIPEINAIITRDSKGFKRSSLPVLSPPEALVLMENL